MCLKYAHNDPDTIKEIEEEKYGFKYFRHDKGVTWNVCSAKSTYLPKGCVQSLYTNRLYKYGYWYVAKTEGDISGLDKGSLYNKGFHIHRIEPKRINYHSLDHIYVAFKNVTFYDLKSAEFIAQKIRLVKTGSPEWKEIRDPLKQSIQDIATQ